VIVGLEGKIERREATYLHLNVNGVIYEGLYIYKLLKPDRW